MTSPHIHKRQLFHWIGRHINQDRELSGEERVQRYVDALRGSVCDGLWMAQMDEEIVLGRRKHSLSRRMVCFTENRLSECRFHASRYGHLGLGFRKLFVLRAGGKPVSYVHHKQGDLYTRFLLEVLEGASGVTAHDQLDFIAHFVKPLGDRKGRGETPSTVGTGGRVRSGPANAKEMRRQFGPKMIFQSEGEWRVVEDASLLKRKGVEFFPGDERTYLRYKLGLDLMTVVFPDRRTQHAALSDQKVGEALRKAEPPVAFYHLDEISEL